ncbi:HD family phosphohydrolase [Psychromonas ossibalaenae]|uniref:HD family phosphohydrolase n=1 Tax=Psychromonas ossibalaenae TaxID=444922 RepID=UPI0003788EA7|nr:HD family phosphohydrolase [Psychromonas ossibalaenae]
MKLTDDSNLHQKLLIAHGPVFALSGIQKELTKQHLSCVCINNKKELQVQSPALLILDKQLLTQLNQDSAGRWHKPESLQVIAEEHLDIEADLYVPKGFTKKVTMKHIESALQSFIQDRQQEQLSRLLADKSINLNRLADIGIALSAEKNLTALLIRILTEGRKLACCDAASLFLLDNQDSKNSKLILKLTQNASIDFHFEEQCFPLNDSSISGYVATHGRELNIDDVYDLKDKPYQFNSIFDDATGYRCRSLLALPIQNHHGEVIGILQFINRTRQPDIRLSSHKITRENVIAFDDNICPQLRALASQSAIAIENRRLIESIHGLFKGFVQASVTAIEQRDPTTSGHSFRVADLCLALAKSLQQAALPQYQKQLLDEKKLRQLKYAALLHDFGKVGVREAVLTKAKKLTVHQLDVIKYRIRLAQQTLLRQRAESELQLFQQQGCRNSNRHLRQQEQIQQQIVQLEQFWQDILKANEPTILPESLSSNLEQIHAYHAPNDHGILTPLINHEELLALSIPKGSLSLDEMTEIRSHVTHTENFLRQIPWTQELQDIPDIAAAHHEKIDGSGYPRGLTTNQIPLPSQIMTVCDIYDALTASDRPYKHAVPNELAFKILHNEAEKQQLNGDLVKLFIDTKVYLVIKDKLYRKPGNTVSCFHHHVCDFDLLDNS